MKVFYFRDKHKRPVVSVASEKSNDETEIYFQIATWNPCDELNKSRGRQIAMDRLETKRLAFIVPNNGRVWHSIATRISSETSFPKRAREAARLWLSSISK